MILKYRVLERYKKGALRVPKPLSSTESLNVTCQFGCFSPPNVRNFQVCIKSVSTWYIGIINN